MNHARASLEAEAIGKPMLPIFVAIIYGVYRLFIDEPGQFPQGFVLFGGGVASLLAVFAYARLLSLKPKRSWRNAVRAFGGLIPYVYSLYVILGIGLVSVLDIFGGFHVGTLIFGIFWAAVGYAILNGFYRLTELVDLNIQQS